MKKNTVEKIKNRVFSIVKIIILVFFSLLFLFPLLWLLDATFRPQIEVFQVPPVIFQKPLIEAFSSYSFNSIIKALIEWKAILSLSNSVLVTVSGIFLTLLLCSLTAYAFSYLEFPGKNVIFLVVLSTMMLPFMTMLVPYYRVLSSLGLINNLLGLIIPYSISAFNVFLLRQYFIKIPFAFIESARLEGATNFQILLKLILPLAKPALASLAIIQFRAIWNDFLMPMIILRSDTLFTLPIKIQIMDSQHLNKPYDAIIATGFIAALIPVVFFLFFQRQFIEGLSGGIKD